jgi:hypothetical protein
MSERKHSTTTGADELNELPVTASGLDDVLNWKPSAAIREALYREAERMPLRWRIYHMLVTVIAGARSLLRGLVSAGALLKRGKDSQFVHGVTFVVTGISAQTNRQRRVATGVTASAVALIAGASSVVPLHSLLPGAVLVRAFVEATRRVQHLRQQHGEWDNSSDLIVCDLDSIMRIQVKAGGEPGDPLGSAQHIDPEGEVDIWFDRAQRAYSQLVHSLSHLDDKIDIVSNVDEATVYRRDLQKADPVGPGCRISHIVPPRDRRYRLLWIAEPDLNVSPEDPPDDPPVIELRLEQGVDTGGHFDATPDLTTPVDMADPPATPAKRKIKIQRRPSLRFT